jgi:biopolymer transport protein ExbD
VGNQKFALRFSAGRLQSACNFLAAPTQQPDMRIPSSHSHDAEDRAAAAMTPMIDVVFLLLIFFVVAAAGAIQESVLATDLAPLGAVETTDIPPPEDPWKVQVFLRVRPAEAGDGVIVDMNGTEYSDLGRLESQLQALAGIDPTNPVVLSIADGVNWGAVIDLYDRCRRAGLQSVNFEARTPKVPAAAAELTKPMMRHQSSV